MNKLINEINGWRDNINNTIEEENLRLKEHKNCERCNGSGVVSVPNGPEDFDLVYCGQ